MALGPGQYQDRTVKSISEEVGLNKGKVKEGLRRLFDNGLVQKRPAKDGTFWSLTKEGWQVHQDIGEEKTL